MPKRPKKFYRKTKRNGKNQELRIKNKEVKVSDIQVEKKVFPRNHRSITESSSPKDTKQEQLGSHHQPEAKKRFRLFGIIPILIALVCIISIASLIWIIPQVKEEYKKFELVDSERKNLQAKYNQLEQTAISHPGSRDIYLQMALVSYQLKDMKKAQGFIERALTLDPNFEEAKRLKSLINK